MIRNNFYIIIISIAIQNSYAQFGPEQIIATDLINASSVFAADIDGDGDIDVLASSLGNDNLTWYENTDGHGNFGSENFLSNSTDGAFAIFAADIDNDGDQDVLNASLYWNLIVWYKNTDGQGTFSPRPIASETSGYGVWWVYPGDVDNDGDLDLLYCYAYDDKIVWFENLDGLGNFGAQQIITEEALRPTCAYFCDLDNDGDLDILSSSLLDDKIAWYENLNGLGDYGSQQIISVDADEAISVFPTDVDGDGDLDVISSSIGDNKIAWYQNLNGAGAFGTQQVLLTELDEPRMVYSTDLDEDGDMDILVASLGNDKIVYYENTDGLGSFGPQQTISENAGGAISIYTSDMDGDGDQDVLAALWYDDKITWYENLTILGMNDNLISQIKVSPNPTKGILNVDFSGNVSSLTIYDSLGRLIFYNSYLKSIDISSLEQGLYFLSIADTDGNHRVVKVVKE